MPPQTSMKDAISRSGTFRINLFFALFLSLFAAPALAQTPSSVTGIWYDSAGEGGIEVAPCGNRMCGHIVWLKNNVNAEGKPLRDRYNPNEALRTRPICGLQILRELQPLTDGSWGRGIVYDPKKGAENEASIKPLGGGKLLLTGYGVFGLSKSFEWTRAPDDIQRCGTNAAQPVLAPNTQTPPANKTATPAAATAAPGTSKPAAAAASAASPPATSLKKATPASAQAVPAAAAAKPAAAKPAATGKAPVPSSAPKPSNAAAGQKLPTAKAADTSKTQPSNAAAVAKPATAAKPAANAVKSAKTPDGSTATSTANKAAVAKPQAASAKVQAPSPSTKTTATTAQAAKTTPPATKPAAPVVKVISKTPPAKDTATPESKAVADDGTDAGGTAAETPE